MPTKTANLKTPEGRREYWGQISAKHLLGRTILETGHNPDGTAYFVVSKQPENWTSPKGRAEYIFFIMSDDEGNDNGALHYEKLNSQGKMVKNEDGVLPTIEHLY